MEKTAAKTTIVEGETKLPTKKQKTGEPQQQHHDDSKLTAAEVIAVDPEALSCRNCLHLLAPPVMQCAAGHLICSSCHDNLPDKERCVLCFLTFFTATSYSRCHTVEGILRSVPVACANTIAGSVTLPRGVVKMGPCGGIDGNAWDMGVGVDRIIEVIVWHSDAVDAISVLYEQDGREKKINPPVSSQPDDEGSKFYLESDEYLTGVKGYVSHYITDDGDDRFIVRSLTFLSNRHTFGPYGEEEGEPFELPAAGGRISGFHGRSEGWLKALGIYVKTVAKTTIVEGEPQHQLHGERMSVPGEALCCPRCLRPLVLPVLQCAAGHLICSSCHDKLPDKNKCLSCTTTSLIPTSYSRCRAVEGILRSIRAADTIADSGGLPRWVMKMGPCGGGGHDAWAMDVRGIDRIIKLVVWHGDVVDGMSVLYVQDGREKETKSLLGSPGNGCSEICLESDEYLTAVRGHIGNYGDSDNNDDDDEDNFNNNNDKVMLVVRSLTFVSNRLTTFGPYGKEEGEPFELPAVGGRIIGFHGRSGPYLKAIGTYVKKMVL